MTASEGGRRCTNECCWTCRCERAERYALTSSSPLAGLTRCAVKQCCRLQGTRSGLQVIARLGCNVAAGNSYLAALRNTRKWQNFLLHNSPHELKSNCFTSPKSYTLATVNETPSQRYGIEEFSQKQTKLSTYAKLFPPSQPSR